MNSDTIQNLKKDIVSIGRLLWEKDLVSGLNGNISVRLDNDKILLTAHGCGSRICPIIEAPAIQ